MLEQLEPVRMPMHYGHFTAWPFEDTDSGLCHVAMTVGDPFGPEPVLTRVHSECLTGDVLHSLRCDCGEQLAAALTCLQLEERGVLLYLRQEGRGIGLANKLRAYALQDRGADTVDANTALGLPVDARDYRAAARMLQALGVGRVQLLTNNPDKLQGLALYGIDVVCRIPLEVPASEHNQRYLETKHVRLGHYLAVPAPQGG